MTISALIYHFLTLAFKVMLAFAAAFLFVAFAWFMLSEILPSYYPNCLSYINY